MEISEGGMLLNPSGGLVVDQELDLCFSLPDRPQALMTHARVVRKVPPDGIGLMFLAVNPQDKEAIQEYIARCVED